MKEGSVRPHNRTNRTTKNDPTRTIGMHGQGNATISVRSRQYFSSQWLELIKIPRLYIASEMTRIDSNQVPRLHIASKMTGID